MLYLTFKRRSDEWKDRHNFNPKTYIPLFDGRENAAAGPSRGRRGRGEGRRRAALSDGEEDSALGQSSSSTRRRGCLRSVGEGEKSEGGRGGGEAEVERQPLASLKARVVSTSRSSRMDEGGSSTSVRKACGDASRASKGEERKRWRGGGERSSTGGGEEEVEDEEAAAASSSPPPSRHEASESGGAVSRRVVEAVELLGNPQSASSRGKTKKMMKPTGAVVISNSRPNSRLEVRAHEKVGKKEGGTAARKARSGKGCGRRRSQPPRAAKKTSLLV